MGLIFFTEKFNHIKFLLKKIKLLFLEQQKMGVTGLYDWLTKKEPIYCPEEAFVSEEHKLLVDAKLFMYKVNSEIPASSENFIQDLADAIIKRFDRYKNVTFVNDGDQVPQRKLKVLERRKGIKDQTKQNLEHKKKEYDLLNQYYACYKNEQENLQNCIHYLQDESLYLDKGIELLTEAKNLEDKQMLTAEECLYMIHLRQQGTEYQEKANKLADMVQSSQLESKQAEENLKLLEDQFVNQANNQSKKRKKEGLENSPKTQQRCKLQKIREEDSCQVFEEYSKQISNLTKTSRSITTEISKQVCVLLAKIPNWQVIQCDGEADRTLVSLSTQYDYVVSEDGDLLVSGVNNLLRNFGSKRMQVYSCEQILKTKKLNNTQLKEIACLAQCDYCDGLPKMGCQTAYGYMIKYKSTSNIFKNLTKKERETFQFTPEFVQEVSEAILEF